MRKVWITIITYNNAQCLNDNLEALFNSDLCTSGKYQWYIEIINNHPVFSISPKFINEVTIHNQTLRPHWSWSGYFTRDCNSALIRGFKNLRDPINDQVIILQDDVCVKSDFMTKLSERHNSGISFIMSGIGDALNSWIPNAVQQIGLYDERFQTGFHEGDYALRAIQKLGKKCSIGDIAHGRVWNPTDNGAFYWSNSGLADANSGENRRRAESDLVICPPFSQEQLNNVYKRSASTWHEQLFKLKWGEEHTFYNWSEDFMHNVIPTLKQKTQNFILYPHFEKDIDGIYTDTYELRIPEHNITVERLLYCNTIYNGPGARHEQ